MKSWLTLGVSLLLATSTFGQPADPASRLRDALAQSFGSRSSGGPSTQFVAYAPFLPVDSALVSPNFDIAQSSLQLLTDVAPSPSTVYSSTGRKTYSVYDVILKNRATEPWVLSAEDASTLQRSKHVLLRDRCVYAFFYRIINGEDPPEERSRTYEAYIEYSVKVASLRTKLLGVTDPVAREALALEIAATETEWETKGHRAQVERALTDYRRIQSTNPEVFWAHATVQFLQNLRRSSPDLLPITTTNPPPVDWHLASGWEDWQLADASGQLKMVDISRNWMDLNILMSRHWSWGEGTLKTENVLISDGAGVKTSSPAGELMPLLPIKIVVARRLALGGIRVSSDDTVVIVGLVCLIVPRLPNG